MTEGRKVFVVMKSELEAIIAIYKLVKELPGGKEYISSEYQELKLESKGFIAK